MMSLSSGGGPAGLTAGLYTSRSRLRSVLIDNGLLGGQMTTTELVENYPGFPQGIAGDELSRLMEEQAKRFGLEIVSQYVVGSSWKGIRRLLKPKKGPIFLMLSLFVPGQNTGN